MPRQSASPDWELGGVSGAMRRYRERTLCGDIVFCLDLVVAATRHGRESRSAMGRWTGSGGQRTEGNDIRGCGGLTWHRPDESFSNRMRPIIFLTRTPSGIDYMGLRSAPLPYQRTALQAQSPVTAPAPMFDSGERPEPPPTSELSSPSCPARKTLFF